MSLHTIQYACGHGSTTITLRGTSADRKRGLARAQANRVCPDCDNARRADDDARANKVAKITLVPAGEPVVAIEVSGQVQANQHALNALGYRWSDRNASGLLGFFSFKRGERVFANLHRTSDANAMTAWIQDQVTALQSLGYTVTDDLSSVDMAAFAALRSNKVLTLNAKTAAMARLAEIKSRDPKPDVSPLRHRIAQIEAESGEKWKRKIYGKPGGYFFVVAGNKYPATDAEVAERVAINKARLEWDAKYKSELEAAKSLKTSVCDGPEHST